MPEWTLHLSLIFLLCNPLFSPFLYAFRSQRVQRDVKKVFCANQLSKTHGAKLVGSKSRRQRGRFSKSGCKEPKAKVRRLKSLSCPQLLISSVNENENTSMASKTFTTTLLMGLNNGNSQETSENNRLKLEEQPMILHGKKRSFIH